MIRGTARLVALLVLALTLAPSARAQPGALCGHRLAFEVDGFLAGVPYCASADLEGALPTSRRAIVVVHGTERNADEYFDDLSGAVDLAGELATTLVVAPQFLTAGDLDTFAADEQTLYWTEEGWKQGDLSADTEQHPRPVRVSSFAVLEQFLLRLALRVPGLEEIVVVGHSAGGQFVQRFAAGSGIDGILGPVKVRYVVANPSSYLYFSPERVVAGTGSTFGIPSQTGCDSWYDDYKYGLQQLNEYMAAVGANNLGTRYANRDVRYLLGEDDDDPNDPYLNTGCPSSLQGPHRLARGVIYYRYLVEHFGDSIAAKHHAAVVPGVGHSARRMFQSDCGLFHLFGAEQYAGSCGSIEGLASPTATPHNGPTRALVFEGGSPNPFNPRTELRFRAPAESPVTVSIYTAAGRRVLRVEVRPDPAGIVSVVWNGIDATGASVGSGVYHVRAEQEGASVAGSVVLLR